MRKLLLFLCTLLGTVGAMADTTVRIVDGTQNPCGTLNDRNSAKTTLTSKDAAGLEGVTVTAGVFDQATWLSSRCLSIKPSAAKTAEKVTITAPSGYVVTGYSIECFTVSPANAPYLIDTNTEYSGVSVPGSKTTYSVSNLNTSSTYFWIYCNATTVANWLGVSSFEVYLKLEAASVNVTYNLYESDGTTLVDSKTVEQEVNSAASIPSSFKYDYYYNYATEGTIGTEDCTIKVTRTLKNSAIIDPLTSLSNNKSYYIKTREQKRNELSTYTDGDVTYLAAVVKSSLSISAKKFAIISYENNYYLYSVDDAKFVTFDGSENTKAALAATVTGTTDRIAFSATTAPLYEIRFDDSASKIFNASNSDAYPYGFVFNGWGATSNQWDDGCQYTIEEAEDFNPSNAIAALDAFFHPAYSITYVVKDKEGNTLYTSDPAPTELGAKITTLPDACKTDFYTYNTIDQTVTETETTATFTATWAGPFAISKDYANAKWYYLNLKGETYVTYSSTGTPNVTLPSTYTKGDENAQWAFVGDGYKGFALYNKAAGDALVLGSASPKNDGNTGGNTYATLGSGKAYEKYFPVSSTHFTDGFFLFTSEGYAMNQRSKDNLAYWTGGYDKGSTFTVMEVPDDYSADVIAEIQPWFDGAGDGLFQLKGSVKEANNATYTAALTSCDLATYQSLLNVVSNASNFNYPETGYYRIKSALYANRYISLTTEAGLTTIESEDDKSASTIVYLTETDAENHKYTISLQGLYALAPSMSARVTTGNSGADFIAVPTSPGVGTFTTGSQYGAFHCAASQSNNIVGWTYDAGASQWTVEAATDVELKLNNGGDGNCYATLCVPFDVTISGADAYTLKLISNAKGNWLIPTPVEGNKVPAGTPVLLKGDSEKATATINTGVAFGAPLDCALTGTYLEKKMDDLTNYFVLGNLNSEAGVGFYNDWNHTLRANRAYYDASATPGIKGFAINWGETDGIRSINNGQWTMDNAIFNLNGQRVNKAQKGIYIVNGKKTVIK